MAYTTKQHNTLKKLINEAVQSRIKDKSYNLHERQEDNETPTPTIAPMLPYIPGQQEFNPGLPFHPYFNPIPGIWQQPGWNTPSILPRPIRKPVQPGDININQHMNENDPFWWWYHPWGFPIWPLYGAPPNVGEKHQDGTIR